MSGEVKKPSIIEDVKITTKMPLNTSGSNVDVYVKDAEKMWAHFKMLMTTDPAFRKKDPEDQLGFFQRTYPRFCKLFPIVLRYMIQAYQFDTGAFIRFVRKLEACPYKNEDEYCQRQADYVKYLYLRKIKNYKIADANSVWKDTYDILSEETRLFKEANEKVQRRQTELSAKNSAEKRAELRNLLDTM
jgi:hypothetical protein